MKKVAVICAAGRAGRFLVDEAVSRGYAVTGFVRGNAKVENPRAETVVKDLFDLTREDLIGFDVVIDAFGAWTPETLSGIPKAVEHLCDCLSGSPVRLLVVGGAGSLYTNGEHTVCLADAPDFPEIYKPVANAHDIALKHLRMRTDVAWTYLSPAADFRADGERTGEYRIGGEEYFVNEKGESRISYADYAAAMVDEIENAANIRKRFSVIGK